MYSDSMHSLHKLPIDLEHCDVKTATVTRTLGSGDFVFVMTVCNNRYLVSMLFKRNMTIIIAFIWLSTNIYFVLFLNTVYICYSIVKASNVSGKTGHKHWCLRLSVPVFWALKKLDQYRMETSHLPASSLIDKACDEHSMKHNSSINQKKVSKAFPQRD